MLTVHLVIKGKVQGVFYRGAAREAAGALGVSGWIKNMDNGDVEAMASGSPPQVTKFIEWCRRGPRRAQVQEVQVIIMAEKPFRGFEILR